MMVDCDFCSKEDLNLVHWIFNKETQETANACQECYEKIKKEEQSMDIEVGDRVTVIDVDMQGEVIDALDEMVKVERWGYFHISDVKKLEG